MVIPWSDGQIIHTLHTLNAGEELTGGNVAVEVKVDGITFYKTTLALCDIASEVGLSCPIKPFIGTNSTSVKLPDIGVS